MRSSLPASIVLFLVFILILPAVSLALSPSKVTLNFMCPCGTCDEALSTCECPQSDGYRSQIAGMVGRGYTEDQVIQEFKDRFGPSVLIVNAAMAPRSSGRVLNKRTFGIVLLMASFSLVAFSVGKYMNTASSPPSKRRTRRSDSSSGSPKPRGKKSGKKEKRFRAGVDDELLDDYDHK